MITNTDFKRISIEVTTALDEVFDYIKLKCRDHEYVLLLADGEYKEKYTNSSLRLNPFVIDSREDRYSDESRLNFFIDYMKTFYSFPQGVNTTTDNENRLTMELMVYTHIWESKPFLKQLYRLATLISGGGYAWSVNVPEMSKHDFIRNTIRDAFKARKFKIADIISKGFFTSLRNAFAHSEYHFDNSNKKIHLDTYKGEKWDMPFITYDNWTVRFAYSAFLSYYFLQMKETRRQSIVSDLGRLSFLIIHPSSFAKFRACNIYYDTSHDRFTFYP